MDSDTILENIGLGHNLAADYLVFMGGTVMAAPPPFRPSDPAICGSHTLVTPYYCRLGNLLCFLFMSAYCMFDFCVLFVPSVF